MKKFKSFLLIALVISHPVFASMNASEVTSVRHFMAAMETNTNIQAYLAGRAEASPALFIELLRFADELDARIPGLSPKTTELLVLAEEVGSHLTVLDEETRRELQPIMDSLVQKFTIRDKKENIRRIFDRFWFWSPAHLEFLAARVRNDDTRISTQLMWVLEQATPGQRRAFFSLIPLRKPNIHLRWFVHALSYKYGHSTDVRELKRLLNSAKHGKLRPAPIPIRLDGVTLPTTADLFEETMYRLQIDPTPAATEKCGDELMVDDSLRE